MRARCPSFLQRRAEQRRRLLRFVQKIDPRFLRRQQHERIEYRRVRDIARAQIPDPGDFLQRSNQMIIRARFPHRAANPP